MRAVSAAQCAGRVDAVVEESREGAQRPDGHGVLPQHRRRRVGRAAVQVALGAHAPFHVGRDQGHGGPRGARVELLRVGEPRRPQRAPLGAQVRAEVVVLVLLAGLVADPQLGVRDRRVRLTKLHRAVDQRLGERRVTPRRVGLHHHERHRGGGRCRLGLRRRGQHALLSVRLHPRGRHRLRRHPPPPRWGPPTSPRTASLLT